MRFWLWRLLLDRRRDWEHTTVTIGHACSRRRRWARVDNTAAILNPTARLTIYSGDFAVQVDADNAPSIITMHDGTIAATCTDCGSRFSAPTGPLYLAAAERQRLPITTVAGRGWPDSL